MKKTKILLIVFSFLCGSCLLFKFSPASAEEQNFDWIPGKNYNAKWVLTTDKKTAIANGTDKIQIIWGLFYTSTWEQAIYSQGATPENPRPLCEDNNQGAEIPSPVIDYWFEIIGSPYDFHNVKSQKCSATSGVCYLSGPISCQTGYNTSAYITSSTPGEKIIKLWGGGGKGNATSISTTVTFTSPQPSKSVVVTPAKPAPQTSTPTPTPAPIKPTLTSTILTKTTAQNKTATLTKITIGLRTNETLTLSGQTSPNAKVTLTIQSNPITVDLTANKDGKWTYTLNPKTLKLPLGPHTITAVATSSEGIKSDPVTLATFTLKSPPAQTPANPTKSDKYNPFNLTNYAAFGTISALLIGLIIRFALRYKKLNHPVVEKSEER